MRHSAGPYMLLQGFRGCPARYPIFVSGVDRDESFGLGSKYVANYSE